MTVNLAGGAQAENIVWVVAGGSGVEIGTDATFAGVVLAQTGINVLTNATVDGCLYAQTDVNLQMATVTGCDCDLVDLQVDSACEDEDGEITVTNPNNVSVMVTVTGPDTYEETMEVPAGGSATWGTLADGTYSLETDNIAIGLDITTLDISCDPAVPDVVTSPATEVNGSTATLNGELTDLGDFDAVDIFFEWRELGTDEWTATAPQTLDASGDFSAGIAGLEPGGTYEFRAVAVTDDTRDEGAILSFTKDEPGAPIVETQTATEINGSTATLNRELIGLGDSDSIGVFFEWRALGEEDWTATESQTLDAPGDFSAGIAGLEPGTTYEFRAVVVADGTREEGTIVSFTKAEAGVPDVETQPATEINGSTATLNGELLDLGDFDTVDVFFEWRELGADEWIATESQTLDEPGDFSAGIEGLELGSTYEFRAVMVANGERFLGATLSFTKFGPDELNVETEPATEVNGSTATLNGELLELEGAAEVTVYFLYRVEGTTVWMFTDEATLTEPGPFSATATNLETGTTYEFQAVAQVGDIVVYGEILEFTKEPANGDDGKNKKKKKRAKREYEEYKKKYEKGKVNKKQLKKKRHAYERAKREYEKYVEDC